MTVYEQYEEEKKRLRELGLSDEEYQEAIKAVAEKLGL